MLLLRMYTAIANARMRRHVTQYKHKVQPLGWTNKMNITDVGLEVAFIVIIILKQVKQKDEHYPDTFLKYSVMK